METELDPILGNWYRNMESGRLFEIVAIDGDSIEIQYFESEVEEIDIDNWYEQPLEMAAEPEDWSGPFDDLVADDFGDSGEGTQPMKWNNPTDEIESGI